MHKLQRARVAAAATTGTAVCRATVVGVCGRRAARRRAVATTTVATTMAVWTATVLRRRLRQGVARRRGTRLLVRRPAPRRRRGGRACADVSGTSGEAIGDDDGGDASQVRGAGRGVGGAARDDGEVGVSYDDVGGG